MIFSRYLSIFALAALVSPTAFATSSYAALSPASGDDETSPFQTLRDQQVKLFRMRDGVREEVPFIEKYEKRADGTVATKRVAMSTLDIYPSWKLCKSPAILSQDTWEFRCASCTLTFKLEEGTMDGGHDKATHPDHPLGRLVSHNQNTPYAVSGSPYGSLFLTYESPDNAGEVKLKVHHTFPSSPAIDTEIQILVYVPDLADFSGSGVLDFQNITSHPNNGTYMTLDAGNAMVAAATDYVSFAATLGVPSGSIPTPTSEGASLAFGGLFDINRNWATPHCNHRLGTNIDIGMGQYKTHPYKTQLLQALENAFLTHDFSFPVLSESPDATPTQQAGSNYHWHAQY